MATRFVRVDLSEEARDYRPIAVEPGVPMLDRSGSNARILYRWLGTIGEPVWEDDLVGFYVRDDKGGRLEDAICQPATTADLQGPLRDDLAKLRQRIDQARGETPTERTLRKILLKSFQAVVDSPGRTDQDSYFFKYKDVLGNWRLVWCWGYERLDQEPAPAVICTDPDCNLLFVRRPGKSPRCPACSGTISARPKKKRKRKYAALLLLLLLLLLGGATWWLMRPSRLVATAGAYTGPVGAHIDCQVAEKPILGRGRDVTHDAVGVTSDPRIARFNQDDGSIRLMNVGTATIEFQHGGRSTQIQVTATAAANPEKLTLSPGTVDLAVGTTARLRAYGEYKDGAKADLTEAVEWIPQNDGKVFLHGNFVEGIAPGSATVGVRYRASVENPYVDAAATVNVVKADLQSIEIAVDPKTVGIGLSGKVHVDAVASDGKRYSLIDSSQLSTEVSPSYVATLRGDTLKGQRAGSGKLAATFGGLSGSGDFAVALPPAIATRVHPDKLDLAIGEIADIAFVSHDRSNVDLNCSKAGIVEITRDNRLVGRAPGETEVTVSQRGKPLGTVAVTVAKAEFQNAFFDPGAAVVEVDDTTRPTVYASVAGANPPRNAEIAPDQLVTEKKPAVQYAGFSERAFALNGISPTKSSAPQVMAVRLGNLKATAPVLVVMAPCRLDLTPAGPIDLPLGQMMRLQGFAHYSGGRRVLVPSERLKWLAQEKSVPGLELYTSSEAYGAVGATKAGAGPMNVYANYHGQESNRVRFKSVEADPNVKLAIDVDRTLRIAGETGRAFLTASGPKGDVELIPSLASFQSASDKVFKFTEKSGRFAAVSPGKSMVTASHIAAKEPAKLEFQVCDPAKARLVFDPSSVKVPVNETATLRLMLEAEMDGAPGTPGCAKKEIQRAEMLGPGVGYRIGQPLNVHYNPPILSGVLPTREPFGIFGSVLDLRPAAARVEVLGTPAKEIRIKPSAASPLAAGQQVTLTVEQRVGGSDAWKEVRPDAVAWAMDSQVIFTPPTETLRPTVALPAELQGEARLEATVDGASASVAFTLKGAGPDANDARLVLDREPAGKYLAVGQSQRYSVLVEKDGHSEPAAEIPWPANFENDYVKWEAPVLTAKQEGYTQFMRAEVGGRSVLWHTTTYRPGEYAEEIVTGDKNLAKPDWIKIFSQRGGQDVQSVRFPVGAEFSDFKVEVHYPDGFTRFVTKKAVLTTPEPAAGALLTADHGKLTGLRTGKTAVSAEFQGARSVTPLEVEVLADVDIDRIAIEPGRATLQPGENHDLRAFGYKNGQSVGDITGLGNLTWKSSNPDVARMSGSSVIASSWGETQITVERKGLTSVPAQVTVSNIIQDDLRVEPRTIEMYEGQSLQVGSDIQVKRGDLDVSAEARVTPEASGVVRFDPATRSLRAIGVGESPLGITVGDKLTRAYVKVVPPALDKGELVVEPGSLILAPGQADRLSVYIKTPDGEKIDRTGSAVFKADDPAVAGVDDGIARVRALKPGKTNIIVSIAGLPSLPVPLEVKNEEIIELTVDPPRLEMAVGDVHGLIVFGRAATSGLKEIFPQPDLKIVPRKPDVVEANGDLVRAKAIGEDTIDIAWRDKLKLQVPVKVAANTITDLQINPADLTLSTMEGYTYDVSGMRDGNRVILTPADGVQLNVTNPDVAEVVAGTMTVRSKAPGETKVVATLGGQRAEATLKVTPSPPDELPRGDGGVITDGPIYGPDGHVIHVGGEIPPAGKVVSLRWDPQPYVKAVQAEPQVAKLLRQYENGGSEDVSDDQGVQITTEPDKAVAKMERVKGGWKISPVAPGVTTVVAKLGDQTAAMNIEINGDQVSPKTGTLVLNPSAITLWLGESAEIASAMVDPGDGKPPIPVKVKVTAPDNQGVVSADGDKITGKAVGDAVVTVTAENGPSATMNVHVTPPDEITINPPQLSPQPGQKVAVAVMAKSADGAEVAVQAPIESLDKNVIDADPASPGEFIARSQGQTQLHAVYRGKEVFARVSVAGQRFETVRSTHNRIDNDHFNMTIEVTAAAGEGELEYRVYQVGPGAPPPKDNWVPNQPDGADRKVTLQTDPLNYNQGEEFHLAIEARTKGDAENKSVQKYPLTLVRSVTIEQQNSPQPSQGTK